LHRTFLGTAGTQGADLLERMVTVVNHGRLALVLSLGERTGLHAALRWLWAMMAGGFVEATGDSPQGIRLPTTASRCAPEPATCSRPAAARCTGVPGSRRFSH
jgi:hypothetical protein